MKPRLFVVLLGGKPPGRNIEQHDVFFGVGTAPEDLYPAIKEFWPGVKLHIDAYMDVEQVEDYDIVIRKKGEVNGGQKLFFVNLGGYREGVFDEIHKKILIVAEDVAAAADKAKKDPLFREGLNQGKHCCTHIDDKHDLTGLDDLHAPLEVGALLESQDYVICLEKVRSGSSVYPEVVITGYHPVP